MTGGFDTLSTLLGVDARKEFDKGKLSGLRKLARQIRDKGI